jgi:CheY-like chemotaxis protein
LTGIGRQHHGLAQVASELSAGATFTIYLPFGDQLAAPTKPSAADPATSGQKLILVAEDEPLVRELTNRILTSAGYRTILAEDGAEALVLFEQHPADVSLVLLDMVMPRLGGREVFERVKALRPAIKVVFSGACDPESNSLQFVRAAGVRLIVKPFGSRQLLKALRETLDEAAPDQQRLDALLTV